ncbi:MAG: hypothetical protein AAFO29_23695 [Actinomycetota bacterium]
MAVRQVPPLSRYCTWKLEKLLLLTVSMKVLKASLALLWGTTLGSRN